MKVKVKKYLVALLTICLLIPLSSYASTGASINTKLENELYVDLVQKTKK